MSLAPAVGTNGALLPAAPINPTAPPVTPRAANRVAAPRTLGGSPRKTRPKVTKRPGWHEPPLILEEYRLSKLKFDLSSMPYPQAEAVFDTPEICHLVLVHSDVYTIIAVSRVDKRRRPIAQRAFGGLFKLSVQPFIFKTHFSSFSTLMDTTGLGVTGSTLCLLLMANSTLQIDAYRSYESRWTRAHDLNLVVPRSKLEDVVDWFKQCGYGYFHRIVPFKAYKSSVVRIVGGFRAAQLGQRTCSVTISESIANIMHIVLAGPMTCWMNVLTSTRVYVTYPTLITSRHTLRSDIPTIEYSRHASASYIAKSDNSEWTGKCGPHCPGLPRKSVGDKGIAFFPWNHKIAVPDGSRFADTNSLLASSVIHWRMSARCYNDRCKNFTGKPAPL